MKTNKSRTLANVVSLQDLIAKTFHETTKEDILAVVGSRQWFWDDEVDSLLEKIYAKSYQRLDSLVREVEEEQRMLREAIETGEVMSAASLEEETMKEIDCQEDEEEEGYDPIYYR